MAKKKLQPDYNFNFGLIGIVSISKDYYICWLLNNHLKFNLSKTQDIEIINSKQKCISNFAFYEQKLKGNTPTIYLISNKGTVGFFINERKETDYFLMINGFYEENYLRGLIKKITKLKNVQTAYKINPLELKSKENFIF